MARPPWHRPDKSARPYELVNTQARPSSEQIADRDARANLPARDLTGLILGDPPIGRSALDTKIMRDTIKQGI